MRENIDFGQIIIYFSLKNKGGAQLERGPQFKAIWYLEL